MFKLLFKLTASVCMLLLLAFIAFAAWLVAGDAVANYSEYRDYKTYTCGSLVDDLASGDPVRANHAIGLYTAPGRNMFIEQAFTKTERQALPAIRSLLETCGQQRAYTLPQAVRVTIRTNVAERAAELVKAVMAPNYATPGPQPVLMPAPAPVSATAVSPAAPAPTPQTGKPGRK